MSNSAASPAVQGHRLVARNQAESALITQTRSNPGCVLGTPSFGVWLPSAMCLSAWTPGRLDADGSSAELQDGPAVDLLWREVNSLVSNRRRSEELVERWPVDACQRQESLQPGLALSRLQLRRGTQRYPNQLSDRGTFLRHNAPVPDPAQAQAQARALDSLSIAYVDAAVEAVERAEAGTGVTSRDDGTGVTFRCRSAGADSGPSEKTVDALAVGSCFHANGEVFEQLGGTIVDHSTGMGSPIPAEAIGAAAVPGIWAVGNSADISARVVASAASGVVVGAQINTELIMSSVS